MRIDEVNIPEPCSADWEAMTGCERKRMCAMCDTHVHDLSAMKEQEARDLVSQSESLCVRYTPSPDGGIEHLDAGTRWAHNARRLAMVAALASSGPAMASSAIDPDPEPGWMARGLSWAIELVEDVADDLMDRVTGERYMMGQMMPIPEAQPTVLIPQATPTVEVIPEVEPLPAPPVVLGRRIAPPRQKMGKLKSHD